MQRLAIAAVIAVGCSVILVLGALTRQSHAQRGTTFARSGIIADFTPVLDANGPWQVSGLWTVRLNQTGRGDLTVAINMVRAESLTRSAHTHHVTLTNATVSALPNGLRLRGIAVITSNGNLAGFSGSTVTADITGGNAIYTSNIALSFEGGAVGHFGDQPIHGVVDQGAI